MQIADERTHQCLSYVASVQRQGYKLTVGQFQAFARRPSRRKPVVRTANWMQNALRTMTGLGQPTPTPGESMLAYLYRLGWMTIEGGDEEIKENDRVAVTDLGRAVLAALDEGSAEQELPTTLVLDQDDPVAKGKLIGEIANAGECALVDAYFSVNDLLAIIQRTEVARVLTGPGDKAKSAALGQALGDLSIPRPFEIRVSDAFHDRFVIPDEGDVLQIGTSLTGVGKRLSVMVNMGDDAAARAVRRAFEQAWDDAEPLEVKPTPKRQPRQLASDEKTAKEEAEAAVEDAVAAQADIEGGDEPEEAAAEIEPTRPAPTPE